MDELRDKVLEYFTRSDGRLCGGKSQWDFFKRDNIDLYNEILKRYPTAEQYKLCDIVTLIRGRYETLPVCEICGKPIEGKRYGGSTTKRFGRFCSKECRYSVEGKEKMKIAYKDSCMKLYGVDNTLKVPSIQEKRRQTCQERFGVDFPLQNKEIHQTTIELQNAGEKGRIKIENIIQKRQQRYKEQGYTPQSTSEVIYKSNKTRIAHNMEKYGMAYTFSLPAVREKINNTFKNKYGTIYYAQTEAFRRQAYLTKKAHGTFSISSVEEKLYVYLNDKYNEVVRQYKSVKYPYMCDFYIPEYLLYIEVNAHWSHGKHPYNPNNQEDVDLLNKWRNKGTKFYLQASYTWETRDSNKIKCAYDNKLNYMAIYSCDVQYCIQMIEDYIAKKQQGVSIV